MQRSMLILGVALIALMSGALFYAAQAPVSQARQTPSAEPAEATASQTNAVSFELNDMDGVVRSFADYPGKHSLINFWATWCAPCRREIPILKSFHANRDDHGIQVLGLAFDQQEEVAVYAEAAEFNYPIFVGEEDVMAVAESSGVDFVGLPFTMIVHEDGELLSAHMGEIHQEQLDEIAAVFLALDAGDIDRDGARERLRRL